MRSSESARRCAGLLLGLLLGALQACATFDPERLELRDRIAQGALTREDAQNFRTSELERRAAVATGSELAPRLASALDRQLIDAARSGDVKLLRSLIEQGALVNVPDAWGNTPLLIAAREGRVEAVRALLQAGAQPDGRNGDMTPLAAAALRGHASVLRVLLRAGARVNAVGLNGQAPLLGALQLGHIDSVRLLLQAGASTRVTNRAGNSPLVMAINLGREDLLALLLQHGADPNLTDSSGLSPLYWARQNQREDLAQRLVAAGAQVDPQRVTLRESRGPARPRNSDETDPDPFPAAGQPGPVPGHGRPGPAGQPREP